MPDKPEPPPWLQPIVDPETGEFKDTLFDPSFSNSNRLWSGYFSYPRYGLDEKLVTIDAALSVHALRELADYIEALEAWHGENSER